MPTRRHFLQHASTLGLASLAPRALAAQMAMPMPAQGRTTKLQGNLPMLHSLELTPFVDELPLPQRLTPTHAPLRITMREIHAKVHRDVPPTRMWSYGPTALAPLLELRSNQSARVEWVNHLPTAHFLPVDFSLHGCGRDLPEVRACVHLHGGKNPSADDGYPDDWYVPGKSRLAHYPLQQDAATLWYHDHAMGLNRLNIYAGLIGMALVRDATEDALKLPAGPYELPLTLYDRNFTKDGQLLYLDSGDPEHPWVPEFAGDAVLINGKIRPFVQVEPRLYRLRLLNAANSRFFALSLYADRNAAQPFHQIGSDQGLLAAPVQLTHLNLAPAERADLLIDFSQHPGQSLHLRNAALDILQFRVAPAAASAHDASSRPEAALSTPTPNFSSRPEAALSTPTPNLSSRPKAALPAAAAERPASRTTTNALPTTLRSVPRLPASAATLTRQITLNEYVDKIGNSMLMLLNQKHWHEPVTEQPRLGTTEIWEFINLTEDTHPLHLHLVRFQLLDRQLFDVFAYRNNQGMHYIREPLPPEPNELGWKDVIQCPPGLVTRIIIPFEGYPGKYLYHCHVLEHEANDMMRPYEVLA